MNLGVIGQAAGLFAVTNIDDILVLSLCFAQGTRQGSARRIVLGRHGRTIAKAERTRRRGTLLPLVPVAVGLLILVEGGAFGL
ncbi:hypothetical protein ACFYP4_29145 [Streptomyces sp. NPDC005551]|uniref:hypothetical protein n=1 Tax=unclassified Streptomyces TaxID=2593676 RepID=UPI0033C5C2AC